MKRSANSFLSLFALSSLAVSALPSAAPCQIVELTQTPTTGLELTVDVEDPAAGETLMLVGYVSVGANPTAPVSPTQQTWATVPAMLNVAEDLGDYQGLFGSTTSQPLVATMTSQTSSFGIPREIVRQVLLDFDTYSQTAGFETARGQLTETHTGANPYPWRGVPPEAQGAPLPIVPWASPLVRAGAVGTGEYVNEEVVRHLLANQFSMSTGATISPYALDIDALIYQIAEGSLECDLHMMAISVQSTPGSNTKPKINVEAKPGIRIYLPLNSASQGLVRISQGMVKPYLYFAKLGVPFRCQLGPTETPSAADDIVVCFPVPGGCQEVPAQLLAGNNIIECTVPSSAVNGQFTVKDVVSEYEYKLARPHEESPRYYADVQVSQ